ncbi:MAG: hypothetical protein FJ263_03770 [Planctomycetes bacterium]|nr:hypothetical protein [Planctomycetota bacterium]
MTKQEIKDKRIKTIEQLKELAKADNGLDCFILLNGGLRSSKHIKYYPDDNSFFVLNLIDDSEQELTESQILDGAYTNIGEAMKKGALIMD